VTVTPGIFITGAEQMDVKTSRNTPLATATILAALLLFSGCDSHDGDYFPYGMKGLNVWIYNNKTNTEYFGGFVEASYISRKEALSSCHDRAVFTARQYQLQDWGYVCCTVTSRTNCMTKVR